MGMGNTAAGKLLALILNNVDWSNIGDAAGLQNSAANGSLYLSLHTADPAAGGNQTSNEVAYTGYARLAIARDGTQWTITANSADNDNVLTMPTCTAGSATATHFGLGYASSGAGELILRGALSAPVSISVGNPVAEFAAGALVVTVPTAL